jgi:curli biogenesis system outer membrane secretion channel CsgG
MKKLCILFAACAVLAACDKKDTPAPQAAAPAAATQPATPAAAPQATAASTSLPKECDDYIARVKACVTKAGGAAAQFEQALEQSKAQWNAVADKSQLVAGCKAANDQFGQMAATLKCE